MAIPNSYDILQAVIEATPDAIFVKDLDGRYVLVNEAFARFIGKSTVDIVGKNDFELYPEEDARNFVEADRQVLDASANPQLAARLVAVFRSQIAGGKRYDLATAGRRLANATFHTAHATDGAKALTWEIGRAHV